MFYTAGEDGPGDLRVNTFEISVVEDEKDDEQLGEAAQRAA